jgi:signal transduction histidine kinase
MVKRHLRIPSGVWAWQGTLLVVTLLALPPLVALWLQPSARSVGDAASIVGLAAHPIMLAAAIMLYFAWRLTFDHGLAWLATAFTAIGIKGFSLAGLRSAYGAELSSHAAELLFVDLLFAATVVTMLVLWRRTPPPCDPVVLGFGLGILVAALRIGLLQGTPADIPAWAPAIGLVLLAAMYLAFIGAVLGLGTDPPWARGRITAAVLLLGCNRIISYGTLDNPLPGSLALLADAAGAVLLCTAALGLLRLAIRDSTSTVTALHHRVEQVEARNRLDRERLHEINAAIAGIATASQLMHDGSTIPVERRSQLERMVESEIARLAEMIGPGVSKIREIHLDEVMEPVVTAQWVLGRTVHWTPSGHVVVGRPEDVAEILTTLLENAAQHASGSPVWISARDLGSTLELTVSDVGPGISAEVSPVLFEWGERGPTSHGQGIGLCVAKRLAEGLGGALGHVPTNGCGATFAVTLQLVRTTHGAAGARA